MGYPDPCFGVPMFEDSGRPNLTRELPWVPGYTSVIIWVVLELTRQIPKIVRHPYRKKPERNPQCRELPIYPKTLC